MSSGILQRDVSAAHQASSSTDTVEGRIRIDFPTLHRPPGEESNRVLYLSGVGSPKRDRADVPSTRSRSSSSKAWRMALRLASGSETENG